MAFVNFSRGRPVFRLKNSFWQSARLTIQEYIFSMNNMNMLNEHNSKFKEQIEFGIGINSGEIINKIEDNRIIVEKHLNKKEKEKLMAEGYAKMARLDEETAEEWKYVSTEADAMLDDY